MDGWMRPGWIEPTLHGNGKRKEARRHGWLTYTHHQTYTSDSL